MFLTLDVKYIDEGEGLVKPLEYIGGKSDWIDLRSAKTIYIPKGTFVMIPLGVAIKLPAGFEAYVVPRSSLFKNYKLIQTNSFGVIDNTYCGDNDQWMMPVYAMEETIVNFNDRLCQFRIVENQPQLAFRTVEHLDGADRGGFGSTGVE